MVEKHIARLKAKLQEGPPKQLELLAADLVAKLVDVRLTVAKAGFQYGSDAGTVGRAGRHLRLECKRYADNSPLDDRNLLGEIDNALVRDNALEAWILCSTREVSQQTEDTLQTKAVTTGVPVVVIDWRQSSSELPILAALCAWAPEVVAKHYGRAAKTAALALQALAMPLVERLARELSPWAIGYTALLDCARVKFNQLWLDAAESRSVFGQNVAGGAGPVISRQPIVTGLDEWWSSGSDGPAVVHGREGMGKTWAVVQWAQSRGNTLPIFLMLPASAFKGMRGYTQSSIIEFLADALNELTPNSQRPYLQARVERLLQKPVEEGAVFLLLVDGVNQEPSFEWVRVLQLLGGGVFRGKVRVVITTQTHFLQQNLRDLRELPVASRKLEIGPYDLSKGGEFDTLLALHRIDRTQLSDSVIELARIPRLFQLTIHQSSNVALLGEPTPSRLLWAHARDVLGLKARASLSEDDWTVWLGDLATRYQQDILAGKPFAKDQKGYSAKELGEMVRDPAGSSDETARRLHEIVSGAWLESIPGRAGWLRPTEATIYLALGVAVLGTLDFAEKESVEVVSQTLEEYLDPIRATSEAAAILASALSVLVEKRWPSDSVIPQLILSALLHSQNAKDEQRQQAVQLAPALVDPLLYVAEDSRTRALASARHWALIALREISPKNSDAWNIITNRIVGWVSHVYCPEPEKVASGDEAAKHEAKRLIDKIGTATPGTYQILGIPIRLRKAEGNDLGEHVPSLLLGKPLTPTKQIFMAAAVASAVDYNRSVWSGLKWLVQLNPIDRLELQAELEVLSADTLEFKKENGVTSDVVQRVSALLLWLTGDECLECEANERDTVSVGGYSYEKDYLENPAQSFFSLEHRHIERLWLEDSMPVRRKLERAYAFLPDTSLSFPESVKHDIAEWVRSVDPLLMNNGRFYSAEDHEFDSLLPLVARVSKPSIEELVNRWFDTFDEREDERRYWASMRVPSFALLVGTSQIDAIRRVRLRRPASHNENERFALLSLLEGELLHAPIDEQLDVLVTEKDAFISIALADALHPPTSTTVNDFVFRWGLENARAFEVLCTYLWNHPQPICGDIFERLLRCALSEDGEHQTLAFMALFACNPEQFGQALLNCEWKALPSQEEYLQNFGSKAVVAASAGVALESLSTRIAPWCLLDEAVARGGKAEDMCIAAEAIDRALKGESLLFPVSAQISVRSTDSVGSVLFEPTPQALAADDPANAFDPDLRWARHQAATKNSEAYLRKAKSAGAVMATRLVTPEAARMLLEQCPSKVSNWLEGLGNEPTQELVFRLNRAGGLFLALCEVLLKIDATRGEQLWHVLRKHLHIRFVGIGKLDELMLMVFRAPENTEVLKLRDGLYSLPQSMNDGSYLDLSLAAVSQGRLQWLEANIKADETALEPFRRRRAILLKGFLPPEPSLQAEWREGPIIGSWDGLRIRSQETKNRAIQARHWWKSFLTAPDALAAFCSWQIFLVCVDKMALTWMNTDLNLYKQNNELWRLKMLHLSFNESAIKSAIEEKIQKGPQPLDKYLAGLDSPDGWFIPDALTQLGY